MVYVILKRSPILYSSGYIGLYLLQSVCYCLVFHPSKTFNKKYANLLKMLKILCLHLTCPAMLQEVRNFPLIQIVENQGRYFSFCSRPLVLAEQLLVISRCFPCIKSIEAVVHKFSSKQVFSKMLQISQESTRVGVSF